MLSSPGEECEKIPFPRIPANIASEEFAMTEPLQPPRPVTIKAIRNGPLQLKGTFRLLNHGGEEYDLEGQRIVLLCRCGRSKDQPFCDSSHVRNGFTSNDRVIDCDRDDGVVA
jgi:CDGSH-type Zn-finger protein